MKDIQDYIGDFISKKCPKCGAILLGNNVGDEWCSFIECDYGLDDIKKELGIEYVEQKQGRNRIG